MDSTSSTFRMPVMLQPPPSQSEALLFNDILEEKTMALRSTFHEFLQVQSYQKFNAEFNNFLKRTKRIIQEGHRNGSNISRIINSTEITPVFCRPSTSLYRPQTSLSVIGSSNRSAFRVPAPIESRNNLPRNPEINIQPTVHLTHIGNLENSTSSFRSHVCPTINEECQSNSSVASTSNQSSTVSLQDTITKRNSYSDVTVIENKLEGSQKDDSSNSIESLLGNAGFKIIVGKIDGSNINNNESQLKSDKPTSSENDEKYLSKWSINIKLTKSVFKNKIGLAITGSLLSEDRITVEERFHDAGLLEGRKDKNLIKTTNGIYRLIGNIIGGSPNELYHICLEVRGIPRTWRNIISKFYNNEKDNKNATLNFTLESPAGPSMARKTVVKSILDNSVTRKGSLSNAYADSVKPKNSVKRKYSEHNLTETHKSKQPKLTKKLPSMMSSTPFKATKKSSMFETPSQMKAQENKVNTKLHETRPSIKDSTNEIKKRQSLLKDQPSTLLKTKTPEKTLNKNNRTNSRNQVLGNSTTKSGPSSTKQSSLVNNSKLVNKTPGSDKSTKSVKVEKCKQPVLVNNSKVVNKTPKNDKSTKCVKDVKNNSTSSPKKSTKCVKVEKNNSTSSPKKATIRINLTKKQTKQEGNNGSKRKVVAEKEKSKKLKNQKKQAKSSAEAGLFDNVDYSAYGDISDFNIMASPTKLTSTSCTETSRSETPPLFGHQWSTSGKSIALSDGPSLLSKSVEAKALKRVKAPKLTLEEELKNNKKSANKQSADYRKVTNKINQMLQFGEQYDEDDESFYDSPL